MPKKNDRDINKNKNITYRRPMGITPWSMKPENKESGSVWISMKPKKIVDQLSKGAGTIGVVELNTEFMFLAPLSLNENIVHHWEAYESVASRLAQKARSAVKLGNEIGAMTKVFKESLNSDKLKDKFSLSALNEGTSIESIATKAYNTVPGSRIPKIKIDTPLYYTNSDRRQIVFEFLLFNENIPNTKPEEVLIKPIQDLMKFSSPDLKNNLQIDFPYMWEIRTKPVEFIKYTTCALVGVQPTWNSPYINHIPSSCNLQLTFTDLSPLYAGTITEGTVVNVIQGSSTRHIDSQSQKIKTQKKGLQQVQRIDTGR